MVRVAYGKSVCSSVGIGVKNIRSVGVVGSRSLDFTWAEKVGDVTEDLLGRGYRIASGGAIGADQYVIERLLRIGESSKATVFSAWKHFGGFPAKVRAMHRQFREYGGSLIWGLSSGREPLPVVRSALLQRNARLIDACYGLVVFLKPNSKGSVFTLSKAIKARLIVVVFPADGCVLPEFSAVKWREIKCGGCWSGAWKACYTR